MREPGMAAEFSKIGRPGKLKFKPKGDELSFETFNVFYMAIETD